MTTTGELRAIIEELQLIDVGDATSYLGEEILQAEELLLTAPLQEQELSTDQPDRYGEYACSSYTELFR
jgi:hypothetical protein